MSKFNIKGQIARLLSLDWFNGFQIGGSVWVLLLAARGFSLAEIGLAEGCFHLVSLCAEVPTGLLADVLGRKKTLAASQVLFGLSALTMIFSHTLAGVCLAMGLDALGYNLSSGTREALTYDSLAVHGIEERYIRVSSLQLICYRLGAAGAMLCAGWAVTMGYRVSYSLDVLGAAVCLLLTAGLVEPVVTEEQRNRASLTLRQIPAKLAEYSGVAARFLWENPRLCAIMLVTSLEGGCAVLLIFFLQDGLAAAGADPAWLGLLLVIIQLGSVTGARLGVRLGALPFRRMFLLCSAGVAAGVALAATGSVALMTAGGFCAGLFDEVCSLITDAKLNDHFPSDQRATLTSVQSLLFPLVMIGLSPLAGRAAELIFKLEQDKGKNRTVRKNSLTFL